MTHQIKDIWVLYLTPPSLPNSKFKVKSYAQNSEALLGKISSWPVWRAMVVHDEPFWASSDLI